MKEEEKARKERVIEKVKNAIAGGRFLGLDDNESVNESRTNVKLEPKVPEYAVIEIDKGVFGKEIVKFKLSDVYKCQMTIAPVFKCLRNRKGEYKMMTEEIDHYDYCLSVLTKESYYASSCNYNLGFIINFDSKELLEKAYDQIKAVLIVVPAVV